MSAMRRFDVTVDDPDMATAHRYRIDAAGYEAAALEGAQRAIRDDEIGAVPAGDAHGLARVLATQGFTKVVPIDNLRVHDG